MIIKSTLKAEAVCNRPHLRALTGSTTTPIAAARNTMATQRDTRARRTSSPSSAAAFLTFFRLDNTRANR